MERLTSDGPLPPAWRGAVLALGNFDGFHLGHQAVVGRAVARARAEGRPAIVATFDPHPARVFRPDLPPFQLTTIDQRARLFAAAGVDAVYVLPFGEALAELSPERFVSDWLVERLGAHAALTGQDFTFGRARGGSTDDLARLGAAHGLATEVVPPVSDEHGAISSTRVRAALRGGDMDAAARLLTRPFAIEGVVQHGDKLGRTIGYPTANLDMGDYVRPRYGIYAVRGVLPGGRTVAGAANLGIRPSFDPPKELLEPFFFDFTGDLYGQQIEVALIRHLRDEARFDSLDALTAQMERDCAEARRVLAAL